MIVSYSKLPQRTLAEILASCAVMQDRKFELRVDEWKFVGHPFLLLFLCCTPIVVDRKGKIGRFLK